MTPGPLATFNRWRELGRHVRKGERAITLCMPVTRKRVEAVRAEDGSEQFEEHTWTKLIYRPHWFVLAQTAGAEVPSLPIPAWDAERALAALDVQEIPFELLDGNCLGYARGRSIAISPINPLPWKTRFHELAHVLVTLPIRGGDHTALVHGLLPEINECGVLRHVVLRPAVRRRANGLRDHSYDRGQAVSHRGWLTAQGRQGAPTPRRPAYVRLPEVFSFLAHYDVSAAAISLGCPSRE